MFGKKEEKKEKDKNITLKDILDSIPFQCKINNHDKQSSLKKKLFSIKKFMYMIINN